MDIEHSSKISEVKLEQGRQKIIEGIVHTDIVKQSDIQLAIPSHRTKKWISFEEFKKMIYEGKSLGELCRNYSKHLMAFYSALSQGKINLSKEQFIKEYESGIPLDEIARSNKIPREQITYLREYYGIKRKGATYQKRLKEEVPLSQDAKDIIIGSMLGDGHITPAGYFSEKHSPEQLEYLRWKASFLKPITTNKSWDYNESIDNRSGSLIKSHSFRTTVHTFLYYIRSIFYIKSNNKKSKKRKWDKIIPPDIINLMNEKVLAIWFMDDGHTDWKYRNGKKMTSGSLPSCKICSESFSIEDNNTLSLLLLNKFNINSIVKFKNNDKNKPQLKFSTIDSVRLIQLIKKYVVSELAYKVDEEIYKNKLNIKKYNL